MKLKGTLTVLSTIAMLVSPITASAVDGGETVTNNTRVVALYFGDKKQNYLCTGFLYAPTIVFTAAHCLHGLNPRAVSIEPPSNKTSQFSKRVSVKKIIRYDNFDNKRGWSEYPKNDFAILIASKPVAKVKRAEIADKSDIDGFKNNKFLLSLAGYGFKSAKDRAENRIGNSLTQALLPIADEQDVALRMKNDGIDSYLLDDNQYFYYLKVDVGQPNSCDGDSGAGIFYNNIYIGINAWPIHTPNCGSGKWGIYGGLNRIDPAYHHAELLKKAGISID